MKNKIKRLFQNADDDTLNTLSERYPAAGSKEREKIYRKIAKGSSIPSESFETDNAYEVRGVDVYMGKKWIKAVKAAVIGLVLLGGISGAVLAAKKLNNKSTLSAQPIINEDGRSVITIGVPVKNVYFPQYVENYNKSQDKYYLKLIDYTDITGNKKVESKYNYDEERKQLKLDIITGDAPDIIFDLPEFMSDIIHLDMLVDMYDLMDEYGRISPDDILPNVREGLEINGKMPAITDRFYLATYAVLNKYVGENAENWSCEQFIDVCRKLQSEREVKNNRNKGLRYQVFNIGCRMMTTNCVNMEKMTCDFSGYGLKEITEFSNSLSDNDPTIPMLQPVALTDLGHSAGYALWETFRGQPFTFTGFPSNDENGALAQYDRMLAVTKTCADKEGAWDFINYYLNDKSELKGKFTMTTLEAGTIFKKDIDAQYKNKNIDDPNSIYSVKFDEYSDEEWIRHKSEDYISQEYVDQIYNYILNVKLEPYISTEVSNIVSEELEYVYNGERTPDQCIDILNDRIGTYLAENK